MSMTPVLLHCCCGPCSTASIERLLSEGYEPVLYFCNSNIFPREENEKRWGELLKVAALHNLKTIRGEYDHQAWLDFIHGLEDCPEHGDRCLKCFEFNLSQAAEEAQRLGIGLFTTTLTVSRFKKSQSIFAVGEAWPGFLKIDFKKKNGFARSVQLSKEMGLYRQEYCGCEFSM